MKSKIVVVLVLTTTSSAFAGNVGSVAKDVATFPVKVVIGGGGQPQGGGMRHDQHAEDQRRRQEAELHRQQQQAESDRQAQARAHAEWVAQQEREAAQREADRIDAERQETERQQRDTADRLAREQADLEEQQRQLEARRQEMERQRREGNLRPEAVTTGEVINAFNHENDETVKEYWATLIIILDRNNEVARNFLMSVRGWTAEEIAGLNI